MVKTEKGYLFSMVGQRNNVPVEDVYKWLKNNSTNWNISSEEIVNISVNLYKRETSGTINDINFKCILHTASLGLPSLDIFTKKWSDDKKIRKIIWDGTGWKNIKKQ